MVKTQGREALLRRLLAALPPLLAFVLQWTFWPAITPYAWFLFYPAVFFSSWIGGLAAGLMSSLVSVALAWWFFIPPEHVLMKGRPQSLLSAGVFMGMGVLFSISHGRLRKANVTAASALATARSANDGLKVVTAQLEVANKELEAFSYSVSHDLRAPLRAIGGFGRILEEDFGDRLDAEGRRALQQIVAGTTEMGQLIDDLLKLSRVSRGELRHERVDLSEIARTIGTALRRQQPDRQIEVAVAEGAVARGDPQLLRVALENLLGNAFKFTSKTREAHVEFGMEKSGDGPVYYVRDNGAGFDPEYAGKLFGAFQRLHSESEFPGTGIGLATVQRIVHRHGGRVRADGQVGRGATFYFTLGKE